MASAYKLSKQGANVTLFEKESGLGGLAGVVRIDNFLIEKYYHHIFTTDFEIIKLMEDVEANAQFKGLNTSNLVIAHISAHKAGKAWHYGRKSRRKMKRTTIEIVVEEKAKKEDAAKKTGGKGQK